jgi:hypothetical protein
MKYWNTLTKTFTLLCGITVVSPALAADRPASPGVNARQHTQQKRIHQGVRSRELTAEERKKLQVEEKALRTEERAYKADGKLTVAERKDLHQDANQVSRDIRRQKHDNDFRPGAPLPPHRPVDPGVNTRQHLQHGRIAQGVKSRQLTPEEAAKLRQEQQALRVEERAYKSDGKLTIAERKDLHQAQNQASKDIYQEKHDAETRPPVVPPSPAPALKK